MEKKIGLLSYSYCLTETIYTKNPQKSGERLYKNNKEKTSLFIIIISLYYGTYIYALLPTYIYIYV